MAHPAHSLALFLLLMAFDHGARADERFLVAGIVDLELYDTDAASNALSRNRGDPAVVGRLELWGAVQLSDHWQAYALAESESGQLSDSWRTQSNLRQAALRWSNGAAHYVVVDVGKFLTPSSSAMARNLSTRNPLVGEPAGIYPGYPTGIQLSGTVGWLDYRAAWVDEPWINPAYLPARAGTAYRPDVGIGATPLIGLRLGLFHTAGPYLNRHLQGFLPAGTGWRDLEQRVTGLELRFSRGYLEFTGMLLRGRYDVPFRAAKSDVRGYVAELKYTWTPRFYTALRFERNEYPFIRHLGGSNWLSRVVLTHDLELGMAYRFGPDTQLKLSYRTDRWNVSYGPGEGGFPDGRWLALQLSHRFDLGAMLVSQP